MRMPSPTLQSITALLILSILSIPLRMSGSLPHSGKEGEINQTFQDEKNICEGYYNKDVVQIDLNASKASSVAIF